MKRLKILFLLFISFNMSFGQEINITVTEAAGTSTGAVIVDLINVSSPDNIPPYEIYFYHGSNLTSDCTLTEEDINNGVTSCFLGNLNAGEDVCIEVYSNLNCGFSSDCVIVTGSSCTDMPLSLFASDISGAICPNSNQGYISTSPLNVDPCLDLIDVEVRWLDNDSDSYSRANLSPGTYCIEVSLTPTANCDAGCFSVHCFEIQEEESQPLIVEADITPAYTCTDWGLYISRIFYGSITLDISGGSGTYEVSWLGNVDPHRLRGDQTICVVVTDDCGNQFFDCYDIPFWGLGSGCECEFVSGQIVLNESCKATWLSPFQDPETSELYLYFPQDWEENIIMDYDGALEEYSDDEWKLVKNFKDEDDNTIAYDLYRTDDDSHIYIWE